MQSFPFFYCSTCPDSFVCWAAFSELSFIESAELDWCFVYCLVIKTYQKKKKKREMKLNLKEAENASESKAANIKNWFRVPAKFSRWWVNAYGTEQSEFLQNTWRLKKGKDWKCIRKVLKEPRRKKKHWMTGYKKSLSAAICSRLRLCLSNATLMMKSCLQCQLTGLV